MALGKISPESAPEPDPDFDSDDMGTSAPLAPSPSSPSKRHMDSHLHQRLGDIRIQISGVQPIDPATLQYQISGTISGSGIERAAICVDGAEVQQIPVSGGAGPTTSSFNQTFRAAGSQATIRVYGPNQQYVENSIQLANSGMGM